MSKVRVKSARFAWSVKIGSKEVTYVTADQFTLEFNTERGYLSILSSELTDVLDPTTEELRKGFFNVIVPSTNLPYVELFPYVEEKTINVVTNTDTLESKDESETVSKPSSRNRKKKQV